MAEKVKKKELCDNCGVADSNSVPCYLMFRENTDIQKCGGHVEDPAAHSKLVARHNKENDPKGGGK